MIKSLLIKNFILIDELFLEFENGFNVFIGETGAGKSIIIKAIDSVLGARATKDVIKEGAKSALIEVVFENVQKIPEFELEGEVVISREITASGTKYRLNGALVNLDYIKQIREFLIDIHSQNQSYTYVNQKHHIKLLDDYISSSDCDFSSKLTDYQATYVDFCTKSKKLNELKENISKNLQEIDFLKFQLSELETASILEGEEESLNEELERLSNVQELKEMTWGAHYNLGGDDGILDVLSKIKYQISKSCDFDKKLQEVQDAFFEGLENLKFVSESLRDYSQNLEDNPQRLDEVNDRLSLILKLKRKYGDVFEAQEEISQKLEQIAGGANSIEDLEKEVCKLDEKINLLAQEISEKRKTQAQILSKLIETQLLDLELPAAKFEIKVEQKALCKTGIDDVEFFITTNVSSPLAPLAKVASGGEISRVMLAIKTVFANSDTLSAMVFDEIDTGISGKALNAVATSIKNLSNSLQIFAITHQPIIVSRANAYYRVVKEQGEVTKIFVEKLTQENEKMEAIAKIASGDVSEASISYAKDLINSGLTN